jgi:outer membrane protein assembly factor BamE
MLRAIPVAAAALLAACSTVPTVPGVPPYRIEIQQGNYVSQEMVAQLKPGMSREQVRFILGTPLVTDIFHADRWDYIYYRELPDRRREQRRIAVHFEDGKLARISGDVVPADPARPSPPKPAAASPKPGDPRPGTEAAAKPAAPQPAAEPASPTPQNWTTRDWAAEEKAEREAQERALQAKPAGEEKKERGFFGRMLEKIGF